jgi:hypothetical protein
MYGTLERAGLVREMGADAIFRHEPLLLSATLKALDHAHALVAGVRDRGQSRSFDAPSPSLGNPGYRGNG